VVRRSWSALAPKSSHRGPEGRKDGRKGTNISWKRKKGREEGRKGGVGWRINGDWQHFEAV
jgi:hypothetical protein